MPVLLLSVVWNESLTVMICTLSWDRNDRYAPGKRKRLPLAYRLRVVRGAMFA